MSHVPRMGAFVAVLAAVVALAVAGAAVFLVTRPAEPLTVTAAESEVRDLTSLVPQPVNQPAGEQVQVQAQGQDRSRPQDRGRTPEPGPTPAATGGPGITLTPPRLLVVSQTTLPERTKADISRLKNVQKIDSFDGGAVKISGTGLNLLAVDTARFRAWAPKAVAAQPAVWEALDRGELVADGGAAQRLGLVLGAHYQVDGGPLLRVAASARFGLPGVDGLVGAETGRRLGLLPGVVLLVNGPENTSAKLGSLVRRLAGGGTQVITLGRARAARPATATPATGENGGKGGTGTASTEKDSGGGASAVRRVQVGRPGSYLDLYRRAAAVCPGLSWTVLAAIGQVESSHGRNNGPSSAGAQGPMQFMPATWKTYGVDGDGDGIADIWSPYDAVPGAANYLCANGAGQGGKKLEKAVWFYNHSWDYVSKVMSIAQAYARTYP
ncbi:lytic transglycosylase domain-containing protein [Streptosporangium pseudovulgare]|uniref:lytic transglycosylase domain-containing protein n=1 Tax=Streptosporangium pseudovulgare TaxID=35765 RepID=UPI001E3F9A01|nr:lytic transglycosylase domain-containing protein [Streptosporangium pseudovulgare]